MIAFSQTTMFQFHPYHNSVHSVITATVVTVVLIISRAVPSNVSTRLQITSRYSRRVLEYSLRYLPSTRVANYSDSTALVISSTQSSDNQSINQFSVNNNNQCLMIHHVHVCGSSNNLTRSSTHEQTDMLSLYIGLLGYENQEVRGSNNPQKFTWSQTWYF